MKIWRSFLSVGRLGGRHLMEAPLTTLCEKFYGRHVKRKYSTCPAGMKVTICGAAGCTGWYPLLQNADENLPWSVLI